MATPTVVTKAGPQDVRVHIGLDANGNITVDPDPFWIYRCVDEQVRWVCVQQHPHGDANHPCFTVDFDMKGGSPFNNSHFEGHGALSDRPTGHAIHNHVYKYTINMLGKPPLDPGGGVKA